MQKNSKICVIVMLLILIIISGLILNAAEKEDKIKSYNDYFSKEDFIFRADELNHGISLIDNNTKKTVNLITDKTENGILLFSLNGNNPKIIYEGEISNIWGNNNVVFFKSGNIIYRYHITSQTLENVYENNELKMFFVLTNNLLTIFTENNEWTDLINQNNGDEHKITCDQYLSSVKKIPQEVIENFRENFFILVEEVLDIPQYHSYFYDIENKVINDNLPRDFESMYYEELNTRFPNEKIAPTNFGVSSVTYPLSGYEDGTFFSNYYVNGVRSECRCHGGSLGPCDTTYQGGCDCKVVNSSIQCLSFAYYVYNQTFGSYQPSAYYVGGGTMTTKLISDFLYGAHLRVYNTSGSKHSIIKASGSGGSSTAIYHANVSTVGKCGIRYESYLSYSNFVSRYPTLIYAYNGQ